jgi:hypothetical protein
LPAPALFYLSLGESTTRRSILSSGGSILSGVRDFFFSYVDSGSTPALMADRILRALGSALSFINFLIEAINFIEFLSLTKYSENNIKPTDNTYRRESSADSAKDGEKPRCVDA